MVKGGEKDSSQTARLRTNFNFELDWGRVVRVKKRVRMGQERRHHHHTPSTTEGGRVVRVKEGARMGQERRHHHTPSITKGGKGGVFSKEKIN